MNNDFQQSIDLWRTNGIRHIQGFLLICLLSSVAVGDDAPARRLIYNSDADNMFLYAKPPMQPEDVHQYVDEIAAAGATTCFICPNFGMVMNYPSKVTEMVGTLMTPEQRREFTDAGSERSGSMERMAANLFALVDGGHDPLGLIIDRAREKQMEVFITFRLNECHCVDQPQAFPTNLLLSKYWHDHPEYRIGAVGAPLGEIHNEILGPRVSPIVFSWLPGGFNFAVPEVRSLRLREMRESCERYPIDGLDLDFQRFPMYFPAGDEEKNIPTMTEFIRRIREMTIEVGRTRGRPMLLSIRAAAKPEQNRELGLDVETWASEGLIDFVTASHYLRNDYPIPVQDYRRILPAEMPVYTSIEVEDKPDDYRRIAQQQWSDGTDGIMVFNFFTCRERGKEPPFELLKELNDPKALGVLDPKR